MPEMPLVTDVPFWSDAEGRALQARFPDWIEVRRGCDTIVFRCTCAAGHHIDVPVGTALGEEIIRHIIQALSPRNDD